MKKDESKYFNFPVQLLKGFLIDHKACLSNILDYALYDHAKNILADDEDDEDEREMDVKIIQSSHFFGVDLPIEAMDQIFENGEELYYEYPRNSPKVGISEDVYWDFNNNYKSDFEKVSLLAFLALKSIVQKKAYCKVVNHFILSRMDGMTGSVKSNEELSPEIQKYANEYQMKKIKFELSENWNMNYYGRYTRGFYVSFKMELVDLIYQVEKKRKARQVDQHKEKQKTALECALEKLKTEG